MKSYLKDMQTILEQLDERFSGFSKEISEGVTKVKLDLSFGDVHVFDFNKHGFERFVIEFDSDNAVPNIILARKIENGIWLFHSNKPTDEGWDLIQPFFEVKHEGDDIVFHVAHPTRMVTEEDYSKAQFMFCVICDFMHQVMDEKNHVTKTQVDGLEYLFIGKRLVLI